MHATEFDRTFSKVNQNILAPGQGGIRTLRGGTYLAMKYDTQKGVQAIKFICDELMTQVQFIKSTFPVGDGGLQTHDLDLGLLIIKRNRIDINF